jgi:hypothetical protein
MRTKKESCGAVSLRPLLINSYLARLSARTENERAQGLLPFSSCPPSVRLVDGYLHHLMPAAVDKGLSGRYVLRWPFDTDLAVAALDRTTVDVPLHHWQLRQRHHNTFLPGLFPTRIVATAAATAKSTLMPLLISATPFCRVGARQPRRVAQQSAI